MSQMVLPWMRLRLSLLRLRADRASGVGGSIGALLCLSVLVWWAGKVLILFGLYGIGVGGGSRAAKGVRLRT